MKIYFLTAEINICYFYFLFFEVPTSEPMVYFKLFVRHYVIVNITRQHPYTCGVSEQARRYVIN